MSAEPNHKDVPADCFGPVPPKEVDPLVYGPLEKDEVLRQLSMYSRKTRRRSWVRDFC